MSTSFVRFKKGHHQFAHFVGDIVELDNSLVNGKKGLHESGHTVPATTEEIEMHLEDLKKHAVSAGIPTLKDVVVRQQQLIESLELRLAGLEPSETESPSPPDAKNPPPPNSGPSIFPGK